MVNVFFYLVVVGIFNSYSVKKINNEPFSPVDFVDGKKSSGFIIKTFKKAFKINKEKKNISVNSWNLTDSANQSAALSFDSKIHKEKKKSHISSCDLTDFANQDSSFEPKNRVYSIVEIQTPEHTVASTENIPISVVEVESIFIPVHPCVSTSATLDLSIPAESASATPTDVSAPATDSSFSFSFSSPSPPFPLYLPMFLNVD